MRNPLLQRSSIALFILALVFSVSTVNVQAQTVLADSTADFSGTQGMDDWNYGYRNLTADGGVRHLYDPANDFIPFAGGEGQGAWNGGAQQWSGTAWDLNTAAAAPWTVLGAAAVHPNSTNNGGEHWAIRRWTAPAGEIDPAPILLQIDWFVAKTNTIGTGVTAQLHQNGKFVGATAIAGNDTAGVTKSSFISVDVGDQIDLALTPVGPSGDTTDGSDGSETTMVISTVVDTEPDGLADGWEELFFPGNLSQLFTGGDFEGDGLNDEDEILRGSDPTLADTDGDMLNDVIETNDRNFVSPTQTGSDPSLPDTDFDTISDFDEVNGTPATNPNLADTDGDGHSDPDELLFGSDPTDVDDTPLTLAIGDSRTEFSGVDGQDGWRWGYRNYTQDGGTTDYDAANAFIPFPVDGTTTRSSVNFWNGSAYDWADDNGNINPPWTALARENTHPNGTNNGDEHWTIRRWIASGLGEETPVAVIWHTRKGNPSNDGITGSIHLNGNEIDTVTLPGNDTSGFIRFYYIHVDDGDIVDQVLTPQGVTDRGDGSDGSANWMRIDTRIPELPVQPDGRYFIPNNAIDSEPDGLADFWEEEFFPGDLTQLFTGNDFDGDGALDEEEQDASTDPTVADTDGDGRSDGDELHVEPLTDPYVADSDGDCFDDGHEVATGHDPNDPNDNAFVSAIADSVADFPIASEPNPQGVNGWVYGYYNTTQDGEPPANSDFILFPTDGTTTRNASNFWGTNRRFDWFNDPPNPQGNPHNPPWTEIAVDSGHPNGDNNGDVHWATRRWEVDIPEPAPLALNFHLRKTNANGGNGTTAIVLHNGEQLHSISVEFDDAVGLKSWYFINAEPEDTVEIALTPRGPNGGDGDGADGSGFWLVVDPTLPENPMQPDGTPFVPGGPAPFQIISMFYDELFGDLTLEWTSKSTKEYQIEESVDLSTWTPIGPLIVPQAGGSTEHTLIGVAGPPRYYRILELDP